MSFVIVHPFYGPPIAHHPECSTLTAKSKRPHQLVLDIDDGAVLCSRCHGQEPKKIEQRAGSWRKPVGTYTVGSRGILVPTCCPSCSAPVERDSGRTWCCTRCDWIGAVNSKKWTQDETIISPAKAARCSASGRVTTLHRTALGGVRGDVLA